LTHLSISLAAIEDPLDRKAARPVQRRPGVLDYDHDLHLLHAGGYDGPLILHGQAETRVASSVALFVEKPTRSSPREPS